MLTPIFLGRFLLAPQAFFFSFIFEEFKLLFIQDFIHNKWEIASRNTAFCWYFAVKLWYEQRVDVWLKSKLAGEF